MSCEVHLYFGALTKRVLLEECVHPEVVERAEGAISEKKQKYKDHQPACNVKATDLEFRPHRERFQ